LYTKNKYIETRSTIYGIALSIFDITPVAKSHVYGKQALCHEGRVYKEAFVNPYLYVGRNEY